MKLPCRIAVLLIVVAGSAAPAVADTGKLDALARRALFQVRSGASLEDLSGNGIAVGPARELDVFIVGATSRAELEAAGARVRTFLPGIATAYLPADAVTRVAALASVARIRGAARVEPVLDASVASTEAPAQRGPGPSFAGWNGAGVLVGVVDTGVDYTHPDFQNPDGTTRLVSIWDQTENNGPTPAGFGYGSEWGPAHINAGSAGERDIHGHGTHVLGIAAGDGSATGGTVPAFTYVGMAPRADLVAVKTNFTTTGIVDGVAYVMNRATALGKNAVVNLSLGTLLGPKDGTSPFEAGLSALSGPGRIVVTAAGNDGDKERHAEAIAGPGGIATITQSFGVNGSWTGKRVELNGYYEAGGNLSLTITTPNGTIVGPVPLGTENADRPGVLTANGHVHVDNGSTLTATGDREVMIELSVPEPNPTGASMNGLWTYRFSNPGGAPVEVDLWRHYGSGGTVALFVLGKQREETVIEPANAVETITVGAWTTKRAWTDCANTPADYGTYATVGGLAPFSSVGPSRDGRQKPEITAPGLGVGAANTFDVTRSCTPEHRNFLNDAMQHAISEGTSMAAPHVAGAVALLLQKHGPLTPAAVKSMLIANAIVDSYTGAVWNPEWGHGKLSLGDLTDPLAQVLDPDGGEDLSIGSIASLTWNASDVHRGVTEVDIELARSDGGLFETIAAGVPNTGSYAWTVSGPPTTEARLRITARDAAGNSGSDVSNATFAVSGSLVTPGPEAPREFEVILLSSNPAYGPVELEFTVPHASRVNLAVFDLAGRRVAHLANGLYGSGRHHTRWDASAGPRHAAGIYFIRLSAPGRELTRRIVLAR